ncbi:MAG: hypothetical protein ACE5R6_15080 [Candidatus Heimdallarchaeota archaeon]
MPTIIESRRYNEKRSQYYRFLKPSRSVDTRAVATETETLCEKIEDAFESFKKSRPSEYEHRETSGISYAKMDVNASGYLKG